MAKYLLLHNIQGYSIQENQLISFDNQDTNSKSEKVDKTNKMKKMVQSEALIPSLLGNLARKSIVCSNMNVLFVSSPFLHVEIGTVEQISPKLQIHLCRIGQWSIFC